MWLEQHFLFSCKTIPMTKTPNSKNSCLLQIEIEPKNHWKAGMKTDVRSCSPDFSKNMNKWTRIQKIHKLANMNSKRDPKNSYHVHFIFGVTSYQREKICSLHPITTSYLGQFHTKSHFILKPLHIKAISYQSFHAGHFIPVPVHSVPNSD